MSDIVERLHIGGLQNELEAADEITRLRAEVERLNKSRNKWGQKYNKLLEKHRVTRAEMANQIQWVKDLADNLIAEEAKTSALRAENERLKDANAQLQEIVNGDTEEEERIRAENEKLRSALLKVTAALNEGRIVPRAGVSGMTIEAQLRNSVYTGVPAWPIEEAREMLDEINSRAALEEKS